MKFTKERVQKIGIISKSLFSNFLWLLVLIPILMSFEESWVNYSDDNPAKPILLLVGKISMCIYKYYLNFPFNFYLWFDDKNINNTYYLSWLNSLLIPMVLVYYLKNYLKQLNYIYWIILVLPILYGIIVWFI